MLEALRRESDNLDRARAELIGADPGVVNTTVHLQVSDDLLLRIANDMQRRAYDAAQAGLPIDEALQRWYFKAECLRTVFADARRRASMERHGLHKPACFDPPADYECHPAAPAPASADLELAMNVVCSYRGPCGERYNVRLLSANEVE